MTTEIYNSKIINSKHLVKFNFDVVFGENKSIIDSINGFKIGCDIQYDAISDIKIYSATYAKLKCNDKFIEMDKIGDIFTFSDITIKNPLFISHSGFTPIICTDGTLVTYNGIYMNQSSIRIIYGFEKPCAQSWFDSKNIVLLTGHMWYPSMICKISDIVYKDCQETNKNK